MYDKFHHRIIMSSILLIMLASLSLLAHAINTTSHKQAATHRDGTTIPAPGPITITQEVNKFDLINVLTWDQVEDPDPYTIIVAYNIYCTSQPTIYCTQAQLLTQIPQPEDPLEPVVYQHHCRCPEQEYFYCVTAVDSLGRESEPTEAHVAPTIPNIQAPSKVYTTQKLTQFDLTNKLCWDPVDLGYYPVVGYNIYCAPHQDHADDCSTCYNCLPSCCSSICQDATFLQHIPATDPLTYENHFRCPGVTYDYCISTVAQTGDYTTESIIPKHVTVQPTIDPQVNCQHMDCHSLNLVNKQTHGAPVQAVAWLDANCYLPTQCSCTDRYIIPHPSAAIGGYLSYTNACDGASVRVYALNFVNDQLIETAHIAPTPFVYSVDWCCIDDVPYLAVAGRPNQLTGFDTWIYKYTFNGTTGNLELIDSFAHGATVWSVAWLNYDCNNNHTRYLALGGDPSNNIDIRLLSFNPTTKKITLTTNRSNGATVYSVDWCIRSSRNPMLLTGGKTATENCKKFNFRIYSVSCGGSMNLFTSGLFVGGTIRTVKWHCSDDKTCSTLPYFAIGGDTEQCGCEHLEDMANIQLYILNPLTHQVRSIAYARQQERVFSLDWNPHCKSSLVTAGSGCKSECPCDPNIVVYNATSNPSKALRYKTHSRFDDSVTSLKWNIFDGCSYLLVGAEHNNCSECSIDPFCNPPYDIALYKSRLCSDPICPPKGICERRHPNHFNAE